MESTDLSGGIRGHEHQAKQYPDSLVGSSLVLPEIHAIDGPVNGIQTILQIQYFIF